MLKLLNEGFENKYQFPKYTPKKSLTESPNDFKINRRSRKPKSLQEDEKLQVNQGDLVDFGPYGELYVCNPEYSDEYYWVTDIEEERNNRRAQGWTISKDLALKLIDDKDDLDESNNLKESPMYDMSPQYDSRQSFYGKARVNDNGSEKTLYSYNTPVAKIVNNKVELLPKWDWSQTTLRHIKEFLKQNGFEATSLAQIRRDYL